MHEENILAGAHVGLREHDVVHDGVLHRRVRTDALVGGARREDELAVGDRVPRDPGPVHAREVSDARLEREKHMRLNQPLPEAPHLLARQHGEQVGALRL